MSIRLPRKAWLLALLATSIPQLLTAVSSNSINDPLPLFRSSYPYNFLNVRTKEQLKGRRCGECPERFSFSVSPFYQSACDGKSIKPACENVNDAIIPLGDVPNGRWNMIALLYGDFPSGVTTRGAALDTAQTTIFTAQGFGPPVNNGAFIDPAENFGFISVDGVYRKHGVRFAASWRLLCDLGFEVATGISEIKQTTTAFNDKTTSTLPSPIPVNAGFTELNIKTLLTNQLETIADEINLDITDFCKASVEDLHLRLFWRHAYPVTQCEPCPEFLVLPFMYLDSTIAIAKKKEPSEQFGLSHGNNGHHSIGFGAGIHVDFYETIEIGFEAGFDHFFEEQFNSYRVPTSEFQSGIFPFTTDVKIKPGKNVHFMATLYARHFLQPFDSICGLSFHAQYVYTSHCDDKISLIAADSVFKPEVLENNSKWNVQFFHFGFNYDISRNIALGFVWQAPISPRATFRSSTIMGTFEIVF